MKINWFFQETEWDTCWWNGPTANKEWWTHWRNRDTEAATGQVTEEVAWYRDEVGDDNVVNMICNWLFWLQFIPCEYRYHEFEARK